MRKHFRTVNDASNCFLVWFFFFDFWLFYGECKLPWATLRQQHLSDVIQSAFYLAPNIGGQSLQKFYFLSVFIRISWYCFFSRNFRVFSFWEFAWFFFVLGISVIFKAFDVSKQQIQWKWKKKTIEIVKFDMNFEKTTIFCSNSISPDLSQQLHLITQRNFPNTSGRECDDVRIAAIITEMFV